MGLLLAFGEQRKQICVKLICGVGRRANYATQVQLDAEPARGTEGWEEEDNVLYRRASSQNECQDHV